MGEIRKVGHQYFVEFYARGLLYSQLGGESLEEAQKLLATIESKINQGEALTVVRTITLEAFEHQFLNSFTDTYSSRTLNRFKSLWHDLNQFLKQHFPQAIHLSQITPSIIEAYKAHLIKQGRKPKLTNFSLLLLREMMENGIKIGFINDNPTWHTALLPWPHKTISQSKRAAQAKALLGSGVMIAQAAQRINLTDVARILYFANFIPIRREDMYNATF